MATRNPGVSRNSAVCICAQHAHDVERLSHICFASAAASPCGRNERFHSAPSSSVGSLGDRK